MRAQPFVVLLALVISIFVVCAGCALTSKADSVLFRYFSPEVGSSAATQPAGAPAGQALAGKALELRIGRIDSAAYLKDRIVFRDGSQEIKYYDLLRWSEKPEAFLRRAVKRALFEERGVSELVSRAGPTLEIELDALDEIRGATPVARARATWLVRDEQTVLIQRTFVVDRPIDSSKSPPPPDVVARALAEALREVVRTITTEAVAALGRVARTP